MTVDLLKKYLGLCAPDTNSQTIIECISNFSENAFYWTGMTVLKAMVLAKVIRYIDVADIFNMRVYKRLKEMDVNIYVEKYKEIICHSK